MLITVFACSKDYDAEVCSELAFKKFHGQPNASNEYDKNCSNITHKYTPEICQKALNSLINQGSKQLIIKKYGEPALKCFTEKDFRLFMKK